VADFGGVTDHLPRRFYKLNEVAEMLSTSHSQVYALVRRGDLAAIKLGGRGQYRVSLSDLDRYVERLYAETKDWRAAHPFLEIPTPDERGDRADTDVADEPGP
jgi:excisionase family DNA binding protein